MTKQLEQIADVKWQRDDLEFFLNKLSFHWCGYVRFPTRPLIEQGYSGIATYVPVHGGITFARQEGETMTYGFDCMHSGDETNPKLQDQNWLRAECERMALAIIQAGKFEQDYLLAATDEARSDVLTAYHNALEAEGILFDLRDNFGAMINVLFGSL